MNKKQFGKREWSLLVLFGLIGQIAWSVENMYFNLFVFETVAPSLTTVTLMVQLSGIAATLTTLTPTLPRVWDKLAELGIPSSQLRAPAMMGPEAGSHRVGQWPCCPGPAEAPRPPCSLAEGPLSP